jgi:hypothetical protein
MARWSHWTPATSTGQVAGQNADHKHDLAVEVPDTGALPALPTRASKYGASGV